MHDNKNTSFACPSTGHKEPRNIPSSVARNEQKYGETWKEFFAHRSRLHSEMQLSESLKDLEAREQRTKNAKGGRCPGRKSSRVFYWDTDEYGIRVRTPIGYNTYIGSWDDYHGGQRRYDPFFDEWDLCTEFDPNARSDEDEDDGEELLPILPQPSRLNSDRPGNIILDVACQNSLQQLERSEVLSTTKVSGSPLAASPESPNKFAGPNAMKPGNSTLNTMFGQQGLMDLIEFHTLYLLKLMDGEPNLVEEMQHICDSMCMLKAGAGASLPLWHLQRLQNLVPEGSEVALAAYLLEQCIAYDPRYFTPQCAS